MDKSFSQLLFKCGFYSSGHLDKERVCRYLYCSLRTLNRWLHTNQPCPRAVKLLRSFTQRIPENWIGFTFDTYGRLIVPGFRNAITEADVRQFCQFARDARETAADNVMLVSMLEELRDDTSVQNTLNKLISIIEELNDVTKDPIFRHLYVKKRLRSVQRYLK